MAIVLALCVALGLGSLGATHRVSGAVVPNL